MRRIPGSKGGRGRGEKFEWEGGGRGEKFEWGWNETEWAGEKGLNEKECLHQCEGRERKS